jgi:hypothetical protein
VLRIPKGNFPRSVVVSLFETRETRHDGERKNKEGAMKADDLQTLPAPYWMTAREETPGPRIFVDLSQIEDPDSLVIEVIPLWKGTVFNVVHLDRRGKGYSIGEQPDCDFWVPPDRLGGRSKVDLVDAQGLLNLDLPGLEGEVLLDDGSKKPLAEMDTDLGHARVPARARCRITLGEITFLIGSVPRPRRPRLPLTLDWAMQTFAGISFGAHIIFLFLIFFFAPDSKTISADSLANPDNAWIKYLITPQDKIPETQLPEWMKEKAPAEKSEGFQGKKHAGEEGQMGDPKEKKTTNRYGIKGSPDNPNPRMAKDQVEQAKEAGILAVLQQHEKMPTSPFGSDMPSGTDLESALGALVGLNVGPNFGFNGLGMRGPGKGGGGTGEGTVGVGDLWGIGSCCGNDPGKQWNPKIPELKKTVKEKVPTVVPKDGTVIGSLSKEAIRRVIRQHLNEVKHCYEKQLESKPDLAGRVEIKFIILASGAVKTAVVAKTTLGSKAAEQCIAGAFERWTFPAPPDGGIVVVTYPITFQPASM